METAAPAGKGLQQLEETLLFQSELMELKASPSRPPVGVVIEARMDKGQGLVATLIVKRGTLKARTPSDEQLCASPLLTQKADVVGSPSAGGSAFGGGGAVG